MKARCKRCVRRFRFLVNFLCSCRIYGSANLCFLSFLDDVILALRSAWKRRTCVEVFFSSDVTIFVSQVLR